MKTAGVRRADYEAACQWFRDLAGDCIMASAKASIAPPISGGLRS